jgi:nicotinamidase-related amidase
VGVLQRLLPAARAKGLPIIYTRANERPDLQKLGAPSLKKPSAPKAPSTANLRDGNDIVDEIAPAPQDIVVRKQKPSGFFGTNMLSYLVLLGCDSVIVTGTTTSGCVRATVLDAFSNNFHVALAEEGCFDRSQASHAINLCDMHAKYADVLTTDQVLAYFASLPAGLFELPKGTPGARL